VPARPADARATLYGGVLEEGLKTYDQFTSNHSPIVAAIDDTGITHSGHSGFAAWMRDPLGPAFQVNLHRALRFLHIVLVLPLHSAGFDARALSICFELVPPLKKPGKKATPDEVEEYTVRKKLEGLTHTARARIRALRSALDQAGYQARKLLIVGDGSFTNSTMLKDLEPGIDYLGRTSKDAVLYTLPVAPNRKLLGERAPTPETVRQDESVPYLNVLVHFGGQKRELRYKELRNVLWRGAGNRPLRLFIVAPIAYRGPGVRRYYREPAYLLTTDLSSSADFLLQAYFDRWQIEVVHREAKSVLGVGEAEVWSDKSITRFHSAYLAMSSLLVLASIRAFGPGRTTAFPPLPPWRRVATNQRPSFDDLAKMLAADLQAEATASEAAATRARADDALAAAA
jgi:hypothetical protein